MKEAKWLPNLTYEMVNDARGNNLCSYMIALEGWRRGLKLTWYSQKVKKKGVHAPGRLFSLSSGDQIEYFYKAQNHYVDKKAIKIGVNKLSTKQHLVKHKISVPEGKRYFKNETVEEIIDYAKRIGFPVVIKPTNGDQGVGVIANIQNVTQFKKDLIKTRQRFKDILVEKHVFGEEYRLFVLEDKVLAVIKRIPANIIGDGHRTIQELIDRKNKVRKENPRLTTCLIKVDEEIHKNLQLKSLTLDSILSENEQVFLRENSNISTGGDSVEVTDELPEEVKQVAIDTVASFPNLKHAGVDIIVNEDPEIKAAGFVLEVNVIPQIGSLVFPMYGNAKDIPKALIDYYFPETQKIDTSTSNFYFDFKEVLEPLVNKTASEVVVNQVPMGELVSKKLIFKAKSQSIKYLNYLRRKAIEHDLHGSIEPLTKGKIRVLLTGEVEKISSYKEDVLKVADKEDFQEKDWTGAVKLGVHIVKKAKKKPTKKRTNQSLNENLKQQKSKKKQSLVRRVLRKLVS